MFDAGPPLTELLLSGILVGILGLTLPSPQEAAGQPPGQPTDSTEAWHEEAWASILQQDGLEISYIYYPEADNEHDGIVLRLVNESQDSLRYAFTLVFRAPDAETSVSVQGGLGPGETKTGDGAGLFWMPFREADRNIGEIGLRGLEIISEKNGLPDDSGRP